MYPLSRKKARKSLPFPTSPKLDQCTADTQGIANPAQGHRSRINYGAGKLSPSKTVATVTLLQLGSNESILRVPSKATALHHWAGCGKEAE